MGPYSFPKKIAHTDGNTISRGGAKTARGPEKSAPSVHGKTPVSWDA